VRSDESAGKKVEPQKTTSENQTQGPRENHYSVYSKGGTVEGPEGLVVNHESNFERVLGTLCAADQVVDT